MNRIWREANLMTTILETIYLRYERSDLERDETQLSVPHVDSKIWSFPSPCLSQLFPSFIFCQNYRREAYFSHCCDPNWPHRNIQTTSGSIWLLSITEHLFLLNPGELQRQVNLVLLWRRALSLLSVYGDIEGAADSLGTGALAQSLLTTLSTAAERAGRGKGVF